MEARWIHLQSNSEESKWDARNRRLLERIALVLRAAKFSGEFGMKCKYCGCTDEEACPGGCSWLRTEQCSQCDFRVGISVAIHIENERSRSYCGRQLMIRSEFELPTCKRCLEIFTRHRTIMRLYERGLSLEDLKKLAPPLAPIPEWYRK